jgi:hypothetical protein
MSLIQDALKRKTEEQQKPPASAPTVPPAQPPIPPAPLKPVREPMSPATKKLFAILVAAVVVIILLIGATVYLYLSEPPAPAEMPVEKPAAPAPVEKEMPAEPVPPVAPIVEAPAVVAPEPSPIPAPALAPTPNAKPTSKWPDLRFSGSAAGGNQILAIINGRMLSVGDRIQGVEILQIGKNEVLVELNGEKRILRVDDP